MNSPESSLPEGPGLQIEVRTNSSRRSRAIWLLPIFVVLVVIVLMVSQLYAVPTLQWSQPSVLEFVLPSRSQKTAVSFRSSENLSQVDVFITPALNQVLSVRPTRLTKIGANKDYKLDLTITAPATSGIAFEGTIQLKLTQGTSATQSPALPIKIVIHDERVPPDPGEAGKVTLEGIDADVNGVRDDLERWIVLNYYTSAKRRSALVQYAKAAEEFLLAADDKALSRHWSNEIEREHYCSNYVFGLTNAITARDELRAQLLNTEARATAYIKADSHLSGTFGIRTRVEDWKDFCTFNPDIMAN